MTLAEDDTLAPEPSGDVVHWMEPGPLRLGSRDVPVAALAAFALGLVTAVAGFALYKYIEPRREVLPPWRWRRGTTH
jgi:hypothetical protein